MKIGELSKTTGVSIRMLHHYDEIGLLRPTERSDGDHRLYSNEDIKRLQKIVMLRETGLPLEEIKRVLGEAPSTVVDILDRHTEMLEDEVARKTNLIQRLKTAKELLKFRTEVNITKILDAIRDVTVFEGYLSKDELLKMADRDAKLRNQGEEDFEERAKTLIKQFRIEMKKGTAVSSNEVQNLIKEWRELAKFMTGGNEDIKTRIREMMLSNSRVADQLATDAGIDQELFVYMKEAGKILKETVTTQT